MKKTTTLLAVLLAMILARPAAAQPPAAEGCTPAPAKLKALALQLRAENPDVNDFVRALDKAVGVDTSFLSLNPALKVTSTDALSIFVTFPYANFRASVLEAIRKRDPLEAVPIATGVLVSVSPSTINAPDIVKVIVERDGREIAPIENGLQLRVLTTRLGAKATLHTGTLMYSCSAFAPGATVVVTAIPESGSNVRRAFSTTELAGFSTR